MNHHEEQRQLNDLRELFYEVVGAFAGWLVFAACLSGAAAGFVWFLSQDPHLVPWVHYGRSEAASPFLRIWALLALVEGLWLLAYVFLRSLLPSRLSRWFIDDEGVLDGVSLVMTCAVMAAIVVVSSVHALSPWPDSLTTASLYMLGGILRGLFLCVFPACPAIGLLCMPVGYFNGALGQCSFTDRQKANETSEAHCLPFVGQPEPQAPCWDEVGEEAHIVFETGSSNDESVNRPTEDEPSS